MKFRLVENIEESVIEEKLWYKVTDLDKNTPLKPFYFYGNDKNDTIKIIVNAINGGGTPKQSLNRQLLDLLRGKYKGKISESNFISMFSMYAVSPKKVNLNNVLSNTDRQLRRNAQSVIKNNKTINPPIQNFYIHHINGKESDNSFANLVLIDNSSNNVYADAIHKIIQNMSTIVPVTQIVDIYEFDVTQKRWVVTHTATIDIK